MKKAVVIIPALNPEERLIQYCEQLIASGVDTILVVDDGSEDVYRSIFDKIETIPECTVLRHDINMGKGRALKDAFGYCLGKYSADEVSGVITADSDGQHSVKDVIGIKEMLDYDQSGIILGARDFDSENVPSKSSFGNKLTRFWFKILYGAKITDTQTGLRAIPINLLERFHNIRGERFEYETNMLVVAINEKIPINEIKIETLYENQNEGTHFRPVKDSLSVLRILLSTFLKFSLASLSSFLVDIILFRLILLFAFSFETGLKITVATVVARVASSIYNYLVNKNVVFQDNSKGSRTFIAYFTLAVIQMFCSAGLVYAIFSIWPVSETGIKILVDTLLFLISYRIQKAYIFKDKQS